MSSTNLHFDNTEIENHELKETLQKERERNRILRAGLKTLLSCHDFTDAAEKLYNLCKETTGATSGYVALAGEDGKKNDIIFLDFEGLPNSAAPDLQMPIRDLCGIVYKTNKASYCNDFRNSEWAGCVPEGHVGLENVMFIPLVLDAETVGIIGFANKEGGFTEQDMNTASFFGELAAISLKNMRDIIKWKEVEEKLTDAKEKYSTIFNQSVEGFYVHDLDGQIVDANDMACEQTGYSKEELLKLNVLDFHVDATETPRMTRDEVLGIWRERRPGERSLIQAEHRRKDGTTFPVQITGGAAYFGNKKLILAIVQDISERKKTEEDLHRTKDRLESLWKITQISESDIKTITEHILEEVQRITESKYAFYGFLTEDEKTMALYAWSRETMRDCKVNAESLSFSIDKAGLWSGAIREGRPIAYNNYNAAKTPKKGIPDGHVPIDRILVVPLVLEGKARAIAAVANKKSEYTQEDERQVELFLRNVQILIDRKRHEEEKNELTNRLQHAQKMESIGTLAGGIAHDFNNILSPIMLQSELIMDDLPPDHPLQLDIKEIYTASKRARDLVKQILTFARKKMEEILPIKLSIIVRDTLQFLRSTIPATIDIKYQNLAAQDTVMADPTQLNQIVMNLCTNAYHAMNEKGGILEITLENEAVSTEKKHKFRGLTAGRYLKLSVKDNGAGIPGDEIDRIFEPYFTTKAFGEGTGLGLAIVHGIVKNYKGDIVVESEVGKGTVFSLYLPLSDTGSADEHEKHEIETPQGMESILLIDDEISVLKVMRKILERLGYNVAARSNSLEALDLFRKNPDAFKLIVTDMAMPKLSGVDLAQKINAIKPGIPVILCTGFNEKINKETAEESGISRLMMKPVTKSELAEALREVLDKKSN